MDARYLRIAILTSVGKHDATGQSAYLGDTELAQQTGAPLADVQRQIRILQTEGLLDVAESMGPTYAIHLTPQGEQALEGLNEQARNPIGF